MSLFKKLFRKKEEAPSVHEPRHKKPLTLEETLAILEPFKRTCYTVETVASDFSFSATSKMGGFPYLRDNDDWPICPNCKQHMQLFLQLNLEDLPERKEEGLIQLFYCTNYDLDCESEQESFFPFSPGSVARKVTIQGDSAHVDPNIASLFPERQVIGWSMRDDYPHFEEYHELGIDLEIDDDVLSIMEEQEIGLPVAQDKLFGWPYWVQSVEYPIDSSDVQMELLFQISSEENIPYMFGDMGIGHLTQSTNNPNELGFGWACS